MKRIFKILVFSVLALSTGFGAYAEIIVSGNVCTGQTLLQCADQGGMIQSIDVQAGSYVQAGDTIAQLSLTQVYAPWDGTVSTLFAEAGSSADDAVDKYGAVLSIAPESLYTLYATAEYAYESLETQAIHSGQTVYMKCTANGTHRGVGRITKINGDIFHIEATGGEFYNGETVYVYLNDDYETKNRIGKATVVASTAESVTGEGDIVKMYVQEGDFVEKGQLLFETVGSLNDEGETSALTASVDGYIVAIHAQANQPIEKDAPLIEICPMDSLWLTANVSEADITAIHLGDSVIVNFDLSEETLRMDAEVSDISYLPQEGASIAYEVRIRLNADPRIKPGMNADIYIEN